MQATRSTRLTGTRYRNDCIVRIGIPQSAGRPARARERDSH